MPTGELYDLAKAHHDRGDHRSAIDAAKECYRRDTGSAHTELLVSAYVGRARQLLDRGLQLEAEAVLGNALRLNHGNKELLWLAFECGVRGGRHDRAAAMTREFEDESQRQRALMLLTDEAVLAEQEPCASLPDGLAEDVRRIRTAFEAFEHGDNRKVIRELQPISGSSLSARWKWLLRGLMAYTRQDLQSAVSCWERVGAGGAAGEVSAALRRYLSKPADLPRNCRRLLDGLFQSEFLRALQAVRDAPDISRALAACRTALASYGGRTRRELRVRLSRIVGADLDLDRKDIDAYMQILEPPPEDPELQRLIALRVEDEDVEEALEWWRDYVLEVPRITAIPHDHKERAQALIWRRMGWLSDTATRDLGVFASLVVPHLEPQPDAVTCFRRSLEYCRDDVRTHELLVESLKKRRRLKEAETHCQEILKHRPDHIPSLLFIGEQCFARRAFKKALAFFLRAHAREPLNPEVRTQVRLCLLSSARRRLAKGNLRLARLDLQKAELVQDPAHPAPDVYCQWAALEWSADDEERGEALFQKARALQKASFCLHYQMNVELARAQAPEPVRRRFAELLDNRQVTCDVSDLAATLSLVQSLSRQGVEYPEQDDHEQILISALERAADRVAAFSEDQLLETCAFLEARSCWQVLERFSKAGVHRHSERYTFVIHLGHAQIGLAPDARLPRRTLKLLKRARKQARAAHDLRAAALITALEQLGSGSAGPLGRFLRFTNPTRRSTPEERFFSRLLHGADDVPSKPSSRRTSRPPREATLPLLDELEDG